MGSRERSYPALSGCATSCGTRLQSLRVAPWRAFHALLNLGAAGFYALAALRRGAVATEGRLDGEAGSAARSQAGRLTLADARANAAALAILGVSGYVGGRVAQRFNVRPGLEPPV